MLLEVLGYFGGLHRVIGEHPPSLQKLSHEAGLPVRPSSRKPAGIKTSPLPYWDISGVAAYSLALGKIWVPAPHFKSN